MTNPFRKKRRALPLCVASFAACALVLASLAGCSKKEAAKTQHVSAEKVIPFKVTTFDNHEFNLDDVRGKGKPVVINFWASWCGPCKLEAPGIQKVYLDLSPLGVKFIGVAVDDTEAGARGFIKRFGLTFPLALDSTGEIMDKYKIYGIPKTYVLGPDGNIAFTHTGAVSEGELEREIRSVM